MESYQDLIVWQKAMKLAEDCYRLTASFPKSEMFAMTSQIRRAAVSVPANIAEGWGRQTTGEYLQFVRVAQGSLKELETLLILSVRVGLLKPEMTAASQQQVADISRLLISLIGSLQRRKNG